jgi:hypothetical protein
VTLKSPMGVADVRPCARGVNEAERRVLGHHLGLVSVNAFSALRVALALALAQALVIFKKWGRGCSFRRRINHKDVWLRRHALFIHIRVSPLSPPRNLHLSPLSRHTADITDKIVSGDRANVSQY